jgi:glycosyltransferase involved in cell wall biosynthesis
MDSVMVLGESSRADQLGHWPSTRRVDVIPHGDETALATAPPPLPGANDPLVVFFGSLTRYKGIDLLLAAHRIVLTEVPAARLLVAGAPLPDLDLDGLRRSVIDLPSVTFQVGYVPIEDIARLVGSARVVAAPYRRSNASGVVRLAQTLSRPVVVTAVGDLAETVDDGETGYVVPAEDPGALAAALVRLLRDPELADRMGVEGERRLMATASWARVADRVASLYSQLASSRRRGPGST